MFLLWLVFLPADAQYRKNLKKYEIKAGYGYYHGFHGGFNYFLNQRMNVGASLGSHFSLPPLESERHFNIAVEYNLFAGANNRQRLRPWIFNMQLMYWEQGSDSDRWRILSPGIHIGRKFAFTDHLGFSIELGQAFNIVIDHKRDPLVVESGWMWPILYNGRVQVYYCW